MQLELKHLAPYLPYGLNCEIITTTGNILIEKLTGFENRISVYAIFGNVENGTNGGGLFGNCNLLLSSVKPILRPLSSLTAEDIIKIYSFGSFELEMINIQESADELICTIKAGDKLKLSQIEYLFENHFDIYGLIENNLAIEKL